MNISSKFSWLFPGSSAGKVSACNAGDLDLIPGSGRFAGEGIGYPLQYSQASLVAQLVKNPPAMWESWVRSLGWEEMKGWRRESLPTPVFWPGKFHGLYSPWDRKELDTAEWLSLSLPDPMEIWPILLMVLCIFRVGPAQISDPRPPHSSCSPDIPAGWSGWFF